MNTTREPAGSVLVWDLPVRLFHWLLAASFAGAWLTAESERWRLLHVTLGYTFAGLIVFRVLWGLAGTRYARFGSFVQGPSAVWGYLRSLLAGRPAHHVGHNPLGGLAIVAMLGLGAAIAGSGWALYQDLGGEWLEEAHELLAGTMLALVGVHVAGVLVSSWLHRENLVRGMLTGRKAGAPGEGIGGARAGAAVLMLVAVLGFWWLQWQAAPAPADGVAQAQGSLAGGENAAAASRHRHDEDD